MKCVFCNKMHSGVYFIHWFHSADCSAWNVLQLQERKNTRKQSDGWPRTRMILHVLRLGVNQIVHDDKPNQTSRIIYSKLL